jgi:hypothetical protein
LEFELMLAVRDENGAVSNISLGKIRQAAGNDIATLGLGLPEGKQLLARLQHEIVTRQFEATARNRQPCTQCGLTPSIKDYHGARFRTLFGDVELRVPRYTKCGPLLQVRTSVLDGRLREDFARWYPGFAANDSNLRMTA